MVRRQLTSKALGERIGVSADHVSNVICGSVRSAEAERRIEQELGRAFWSEDEEFPARQRDGAGPQSAAGEQRKQGNE